MLQKISLLFLLFSFHKILKGHKGFVNAITFDPNEGSQLASTGDDLTCRIWSLNSNQPQQETIFHLTSPGVSVCWHADEPFKVRHVTV